MMPYKSYVVWNNKGGTGKTTLVFQLSADYAKRHPNEKVVVIDMCSQANVSTALLPRNHIPFIQQREKTVSEASHLKKVIIGSSGMGYEPTVCGYLLAKLDRHDLVKGTIPFSLFLHHVTFYNKNIPENVLLLCGDLYLEILSKRLEQERQLFLSSYDTPWRRVTLYIKDFIEGLIANDPSHSYTFFIDTSPSFSIYTEMAISAAKGLIVPFMADDFSLSAIKSMLYLVYGYENEDTRRLESFRESQYFWLASRHEIMKPKLHLFVNNRATFYGAKPAVAFAAIGIEVANILKDVYATNPHLFSPPYIVNLQANPIVQIRMRYMINVHDFHTAVIISTHHGCPISLLEQTSFTLFATAMSFHETGCRLRLYSDDISNITNLL